MTFQVVKLKELTSMIKLSSGTIYREIRAGNFPPPIKLSAHASGWLASDIEEWIRGRKDAVTGETTNDIK